MDEVDIRPEVTALLKKLGFAKKDVKSISITDGYALLETLRVNDARQHYIDPQTNALAVERHSFYVKA